MWAPPEQLSLIHTWPSIRSTKSPVSMRNLNPERRWPMHLASCCNLSPWSTSAKNRTKLTSRKVTLTVWHQQASSRIPNSTLTIARLPCWEAVRKASWRSPATSHHNRPIQQGPTLLLRISRRAPRRPSTRSLRLPKAGWVVLSQSIQETEMVWVQIEAGPSSSKSVFRGRLRSSDLKTN